MLEIREGLLDLELGDGIIKKRIRLKGKGKRGGGRVIIAFKSGMHTFFLYGFSKNEMTNLDRKELARLKQYAQYLFQLKNSEIYCSQTKMTGQIVKS